MALHNTVFASVVQKFIESRALFIYISKSYTFHIVNFEQPKSRCSDYNTGQAK